ncbi:hypothetical protein [Qipengyuania sphaerica]|uniref:hypothetical protein n=1 Tax=Qipengyuania sphaerica TaxID=2867243 RepID=UPI001C86BEA8|nr:hypothetical protein [Qipengyuania sphaerica]MBX7539882.1 hypothetical protein [Qipengyuania sphaerica]
MKTILKYAGLAAAAAVMTTSTSANAQLRVWEDYTPAENVVELTYVKVDEGQLDTYLEGLKQTWVQAHEVNKTLGTVESYGIYTVPYGSNEVNLVLRVTYPNMAALNTSKEQYDRFMDAWGNANQENSTRTVREVYNNIRKIKGTYLLRGLTIDLD